MDDESIEVYLDVLYDGLDVFSGESNTADRMAVASTNRRDTQTSAQDYEKTVRVKKGSQTSIGHRQSHRRT